MIASAISDLLRELKIEFRNAINHCRLTSGKVAWELDFDCFSYGQSQIDHVYNYIERQKAHHQILSFQAECAEFLEILKVDGDPNFVSNWER